MRHDSNSRVVDYVTIIGGKIRVSVRLIIVHMERSKCNGIELKGKIGRKCQCTDVLNLKIKEEENRCPAQIARWQLQEEPHREENSL